MVRAEGKPTSSSSGWKAAVDADSVAEDCQLGTAADVSLWLVLACPDATACSHWLLSARDNSVQALFL